MSEINPNEIYTTNEARKALKVSSSTIKRLLKRGILRANKVGSQYRILGKEILHLISPEIEKKAVGFYQRLKRKAQERVKNW